MQSFEQLEVFQRAYKLSLKVHRMTLAFPQIEQMSGLADQMRRASKGICANIAEGHGKLVISKAEFRRFLLMAIGSSDEMRVWSRYCLDLNYIESQQWEYLKNEYTQISKMLVGLHKSYR